MWSIDTIQSQAIVCSLVVQYNFFSILVLETGIFLGECVVNKVFRMCLVFVAQWVDYIGDIQPFLVHVPWILVHNSKYSIYLDTNTIILNDIIYIWYNILKLNRVKVENFLMAYFFTFSFRCHRIPLGVPPDEYDWIIKSAFRH